MPQLPDLALPVTRFLAAHPAARGVLAELGITAATDAEFLAFVAHVKAGGHPGFCPPMEVPRHFLHAHRIAFAHPLTGSPVEFESPMPGDMADYMARA